LSRVLATYNIKGGVGKTSTAVNLAYLAARDGAPTLLWDLDPQGASTYLFRVKPKIRGGTRKVLGRGGGIDQRIKGTDFDRLDLLPADFRYRHMDLALDRFKHPTRRLSRVLGPLRGEYEYIFLDCPPSISLVSESVFEAADALLVPVIPATLSSRTLGQLEGVLSGARGAPQLLAFFSMVDRRKRLHRELTETLRAEHPGVLDTAIPSAAEIERMGVQRDVVASYAPRGRAAAAYEGLWADVCGRLSNSLPRP
jgi:chromosome partitioning protein